MEMNKREVVRVNEEGLRSITNIILVGVLLAAGAVLKLFLGSYFTVMKPNFVIAMYVLSILIIKPKLYEGAIIGLLAGIVCQFFPGTPYLNIGSELIGGVAAVLLMKLPVKFGKLNFMPAVCTFLSTLVSGFAYVGLMYLVFYAGADIVPTPLGMFMGIIFGTAGINAIIVQALVIPLRAALHRN